MQRHNLISRTAVTLVLSSGATLAQQSVEEYKVEPAPGIVGDMFGVRFGAGVGVSGDLIAVGATRSDVGFGNSGAVYLFDAATGMGQGVLVPDSAGADSYFGESVLVTDTRVIVAAPGDASAGIWTGAVYVFDRATGVLQTKLVSDQPSANHRFGRSIAAAGGTLIVGEIGPYDGPPDAGAAYLFDLSTGSLLHKLKATNPTGTGDFSDASDQFGYSVAIDASSGIALVGSPWANAFVEDEGAVYVFDLETGLELSRLVSSDPQQHENFGESVSISSGRAIVGAPRRNIDDQIGLGRIYLFDLTNPAMPVLGSEVDCPVIDTNFREHFGSQAIVQENFALVSASGSDDRDYLEKVFLYDVSDVTDPRLLLRYLASDNDGYDEFGTAIAMDESRAIVGAWHDWNSGSVRGAAYVYELPDSSCLADLTLDGSVNFFDISAFLVAYQNQDDVADFNNDAVINFFDVADFIAAYQAGCP